MSRTPNTDEPAFQVSLDGGETWAAGDNGVRVRYVDQLELADNTPASLDVNLTHEGIILDVIDEDGEVVSTMSLDFDQLKGLTR